MFIAVEGEGVGEESGDVPFQGVIFGADWACVGCESACVFVYPISFDLGRGDRVDGRVGIVGGIGDGLSDGEDEVEGLVLHGWVGEKGDEMGDVVLRCGGGLFPVPFGRDGVGMMEIHGNVIDVDWPYVAGCDVSDGDAGVGYHQESDGLKVSV